MLKRPIGFKIESMCFRAIVIATLCIVAAIIIFQRPEELVPSSHLTFSNSQAEQAESKQSYFDKLIDPISIFTLALVVSTVLLWKATERLASMAESQSRDMRDSISEASRAATAMEKVAEGVAQTAATNREVLENQRDFWRAQMRAYVSVDTGIYVRQSRRSRFEFRPTIVNNGITPANNLSVLSKCDVKPPQLPDDFNYSLKTQPNSFRNSATLSPRQAKFHTSIVQRKVNFSEMRRLLKGDLVFHLWGNVVYTDFFGIERTSKFSFLIFPPTNKRGTPIWHVTEQNNEAT